MWLSASKSVILSVKTHLSATVQPIAFERYEISLSGIVWVQLKLPVFLSCSRKSFLQMYLTRANRHCTKNKSDVKSRKQDITSSTLSAARSDMNWCDGVTLGERMDFCGTDFNNEERSSSEQTQLFTKRPKYHLITGSDVLQRSHVLGRRLMFHGLASSLSLPRHPSCTPLLSLPRYLCLSLPKSVLLQQTLFFNPIWWGPQLPPAPSCSTAWRNVC